eukprot:5484044-Prorocentrum_lima.AAC.1
MTSSLVGSEMCIRDRIGVQGPRNAHSDGKGAAHGHPSGQGREARRTTAVSYTHLTLPTICSV